MGPAGPNYSCGGPHPVVPVNPALEGGLLTMDSSKLGYPAMTVFDASEASTSQQGCSLAVGVEPFGGTCGPACQPQTKKTAVKQKKVQKTKLTVEWLIEELKNRPGYSEFCDTLSQVRNNRSAVRSWTFAVKFIEDYHALCLIVSVIVLF